MLLLLCLNIVVAESIVGPHIHDDRLAPRSHTDRGLGDRVGNLCVRVDVKQNLQKPLAVLLVRHDFPEKKIVHKSKLLIPLWPAVSTNK
ncbi:MAG: hypothetical protein II672_06930, partial [Oscillospiraceae bacterium]|nr:hypothetical protein [Oscillospiraceae bacterium]